MESQGSSKGVFIDLCSFDRNIASIKSTCVTGILRVKLIQKSGPLTKIETNEVFYKVLFIDASGQLDCILFNNLPEEVKGQKAERLFKMLKVGRNYKLQDFTTVSTSSGRSKDFNLSKYPFYIRNPEAVRIKSSAVPDTTKYHHIPFDFCGIKEIAQMDKTTIVDFIGFIHVGHIESFGDHRYKELEFRDSKDGKNQITGRVWQENFKNIQSQDKDTLIALKNAKVNVNHEHCCTTLQITQATQIFKIRSQEDCWILCKKQRRAYRKQLKLNHLPEYTK